MSKHINWPSIGQFREVVKNVQNKCRHKDDGTFDRNTKLPTLTFEGTTKLHGTNSAVCAEFDNPKEYWSQSRERILTPEKDNAGFAMFVISNKDNFLELILTTRVHQHLAKTEDKYVCIFGEWCGGNIQDGVAIAQLPKMFVIFGIAFADEEGNKTYFTRAQVQDVVDGCREIVGNKHPIKSIYDFETFDIEIDFENPHLAQNQLNDLTTRVEERCPVGDALGVVGIGEGLVWRCTNPDYNDSGYWMKVKGEKHSKSKVKTLATVDVQKIENIKELAETLVHNGRLTQICQTTFDLLNGGTVDIKRMGEFIKNIMDDIVKEELDTIAASGFTMKDISGSCNKLCRDFILKSV